MNYFELHIGDYDSATAHLSVVEDGIYGRLMRLYYRTEAPIPADLAKVCRLVRAVAKPERDAVAGMLAEFFELREDGWHNARCDAEIERFLAGEPEREVKKANEDNRLRKHREERARLFRVITDAGEHMPWNASMIDLRGAAKRLHLEPATPPETEPETPATPPETAVTPLHATAPATPATATHTHLPTPISQPPGAKGGKDSRAAALTVAVLVASGLTEQTAAEFIALRKRKGSALTERAWQGICSEAQRAGWSPEQAVCKSLARGWVGFEAEWVQGGQAPAGRRGSPTDAELAAANAASTEEARRRLFGNRQEIFDA